MSRKAPFFTLPGAEWRKISRDGAKDGWQFWMPGYAVLGTVFEAEDGKFVWSARVMANCRLPNLAGDAPSGKVLTLEGAKRVVELLVAETGTVAAQRGEQAPPGGGSLVVSWESPTDKGVKAMVEAAVGLLEQAETLHGQPLYFDEEADPIDPKDVFEPTIKALEECIEAGPAGGPWK